MGLCGDSSVLPGIVKLFPNLRKRTFAWNRAVILPEMAVRRALKAGMDGSSLTVPHPPAILTCTSVRVHESFAYSEVVAGPAPTAVVAAFVAGLRMAGQVVAG